MMAKFSFNDIFAQENKFDDGIKMTIKWYLENKDWWQNIISGEYKDYYKKMYEGR